MIREIGPIWRRRFGRPWRKLCLSLGTTCPNRDGTLARGGCLFCADEEVLPAAPIELQLDQGLACLPEGVAAVVYLQDHCATYLPPERLDSILDRIRRRPRVRAVSLGTRPDCLPEEILEVLHRHGPDLDLMVEVGLQTSDETTLRFLGRAHSLKDFDQAVDALHARGIRVCAHVVLGLPRPRGTEDAGPLDREGPSQARATALHLARLGVEAVKLHNCHVLAGSRLEGLFREGRYTPPELPDHLGNLIAFLEATPRTVEIHRLMGEARPPSLLAPAFTARKAESLAWLRAQLEQRGVVQGSTGAAATATTGDGCIVDTPPCEPV